MLIGHNLKYDLQLLYNYGITPLRVYDTMIVEQFLYLGYPPGTISYSLAAVADRYLHINIDKSIRGQIRWRGLDTEVIQYAAGDVVYLYLIMQKQMEVVKSRNAVEGAKLECNFVPAIAYLEWCGIHLDEEKWKAKMVTDRQKCYDAELALDAFIVDNREKYPEFEKYIYINRQGSLFDGFDLTPKVKINWASSQQVVQVAKILGFDTTVQDKKTGENKDSVLEKHLKTQKGINDKFLELYFTFQEYYKVVSSFGQGHLNAINPKTDRIHTVYRQLGTSSGRLACGSQQPNTELAKLKGIPAKECTYPNIQQLPHDEVTRACFTAPEGYLWVSCDFSAEESRLGAHIYKDGALIKEFLEGTGDTHSLFAWEVFKKECKECGCTSVADVKHKAKQWRQAVKAVEFAYMFGAAAHTISVAAGCSVEEAQNYIDRLDAAFTGIANFAMRGTIFVKQHGYVVINPQTNHRMYWWDWEDWKKRRESFTPEFWEDYRENHKGTGDSIALMVRQHFQAIGKWGRMARNAPTQGCGAIIMKEAMTALFKWIVENKLFGKVEISASNHDEINCIYPENLSSFPTILQNIMEKAAAKYCTTVPIPAEPEVGKYWKH